MRRRGGGGTAGTRGEEAGLGRTHSTTTTHPPRFRVPPRGGLRKPQEGGGQTRFSLGNCVFLALIGQDLHVSSWDQSWRPSVERGDWIKRLL